MKVEIDNITVVWIILITIYAGFYCVSPQHNQTIAIIFLWLWLILTIFGKLPRIEYQK